MLQPVLLVLVLSQASVANAAAFPFPPLMNPERGFRMETEQITEPASLAVGLAACKQYNMTVTLGYAYLSAYWNVTVLPQAYLGELEAAFGEMRGAGVKVVLNFAYMDGKANFSADPEPLTLDLIYGHIAQLAPVVHRNADVVHALQAGFIGNAGEWAHDIRGFTKNATGLATMVARELYTLLPPDRAVLVRRPYQKRNWLLGTALPPSDPDAARWNGAGGGFAVADAAGVGSQRAPSRLGLYNAGFLSNPQDGGTWSDVAAFPVDDRDPYFRYMTAESPFVPVDGEVSVICELVRPPPPQPPPLSTPPHPPHPPPAPTRLKRGS